MISFVKLETEDFSCRAIPLYDMPATAVFEALGDAVEGGPSQMLKAAELLKLAVLDGKGPELNVLSYAQFGELLTDWMEKSSHPDSAEELDFGVDGPEVSSGASSGRMDPEVGESEE